MTDIREQVLVRLAEILATIPNIRDTARNPANLPDNQLPAAILFDGDEDPIDTATYPTGHPRLFNMRPTITLTQQASAPGSDLNTMRADLIRLVISDTPLQTIIGTQGSVAYDGCETGFYQGRSLQGTMNTTFAIQYALEPRRL